MRIKRGTTVRAKHRKLITSAKGFRTLRRTNVKRAREAILKAGQYAYRDRRNKKRSFRSLWINRINSALTGMGIKYNRFIKTMTDKSIELDRKILAQLAAQHTDVFEKIAREISQ
ncbi:TPA: 50S ribosomal protein L20 [Patescibacteria group bacterium]|uniref:Large ribosomal subunit protein bL20 n=2 Tax=Bacteria division Kazan-3B-28 TaxID=1798534 RepID=A0A0G1X6T0_UNCK3|nr:MAG: 50S ribosomal subunit protein L20 [candidate division Kazan bacterium GW2011_GWA1_50_15]KKW25379.1 MAG: 50S ribosomal protein L20 [candidate division Kazan bacterium GW2011_GWC1_52_13]KKW26686.1 MAG: 50S ribosomal protein L20 [candidate division Kazan bacterium GW2011_GWB1_52_7]HAV65895.1 50S ribosomal protein L20 [Patescibacteria group bacterium]HCL47872.1 50S ribosomal protein L20 [Patescibacteria group bacterium]